MRKFGGIRSSETCSKRIENVFFMDYLIYMEETSSEEIIGIVGIIYRSNYLTGKLQPVGFTLEIS